MNSKKVQMLVFGGLFSAIAFVLYLFEIPFIGHLKLDISDIPALLGSIVFTPVFGIVVELVKNLLELLVRGLGAQMGFGNIMNFSVGCAYVIPFALIWRKKTNAKGFALAAICGLFSIVVIGLAGNALIVPPYFRFFLHTEIDSATLKGAILSATALNAVKGAILTAVAYPLIQLSHIFKKIMKNN
ncbi:MAG TPA: hypothetical protein DDY98_05690 [Ruminococcaceae bacterium]|nr:hypothetical protein [Oscillospiraceae bacterium]